MPGGEPTAGPYAAAAVAEALWPIVENAPAGVVDAGQRRALRKLLDQAWVRAPLTEDDAASIEELIPTDHGVWEHEFGYLQNALAALACAVRASSDPSDAQAASWALDQLDEAADYSAQSTADDYADAEDTAVGRAVHAAKRELLDASGDGERARLVARSWSERLARYWT